MRPLSDHNNNNISKEVYYHDATGYKSINDTYKVAKYNNNNITFDYVKTWFKYQCHIQLQTSRISKNKVNSYVTKKNN